MSNHFIRNICLAALLCGHALAASALPRPQDPIPIGPQVKAGKLANGLSYYESAALAAFGLLLVFYREG